MSSQLHATDTDIGVEVFYWLWIILKEVKFYLTIFNFLLLYDVILYSILNMKTSKNNYEIVETW
jgi:hypothetical protein